MQLILFSVLLVCLYFGVSIGFSAWLAKQGERSVGDRLQSAVAAFLLGGTMLGFVGTNFILGGPNLTLYTCMIGCLFVLLYMTALWPRTKLLWVPLFSAVGAYLVHLTFPALNIEIWQYVAMAVVWSIVMFIVMFFDRLPLLSFLTMASWTLAFAIVGLLENLLPFPLVILLLVVFASLWAVINVLSRRMEISLGVYASVFVGFVMGGVIASSIAFKVYGSGLTLMSYYLFELSLFGLAWLGLHPLNMNKGDFAFISALQQKQPSFVVKTVFYHEVLLALLAATMWQTSKFLMLLVACLIILFNLYRKIGMRTMTKREIWEETKKDIKSMIHKKDEIFSPENKPVEKKEVMKKSHKKHVKKTISKRKKKK